MNLLTREQHVVLDFATVIVFALAPLVVDLGGAAATLSYALAVIHLLMTLITSGLPRVPGRLIPLALHGMVEAVVGVVLGFVGWLAFAGRDQAFYLVMAAVILLVFALTPYLDESG